MYAILGVPLREICTDFHVFIIVIASNVTVVADIRVRECALRLQEIPRNTF